MKDELVYNPNYNKQNHPFLEDYYFWKSLDTTYFYNPIKIPSSRMRTYFKTLGTGIIYTLMSSPFFIKCHLNLRSSKSFLY